MKFLRFCTLLLDSCRVITHVTYCIASELNFAVSGICFDRDDPKETKYGCTLFNPNNSKGAEGIIPSTKPLRSIIHCTLLLLPF